MAPRVPSIPHVATDHDNREFGRDGVSGMVTLDRAMRARDVSRPQEEDAEHARRVADALIARVEGRRPRRS